MDERLTLPRNTNQVRGLARYAIDFLADRFPEPSDAAYGRVEQFHLDCIACGVSRRIALRHERAELVATRSELGYLATSSGGSERYAPHCSVVACW